MRSWEGQWRWSTIPCQEIEKALKEVTAASVDQRQAGTGEHQEDLPY